jgi:hypothetical protein
MSLRRRDFITLLGGAAASPIAARAQRPIPVIAFLGGETPDVFAALVEPSAGLGLLMTGGPRATP